MPIKVYDGDFNETPWAAGSPAIVVEFGAGDTRVTRVARDAGIDFRVYAATPAPVGTIVEPNTPAAVVGTPAVVLSFPDAATARLVLDFWRAQIDAPPAGLAAAVEADPRYIKPPPAFVRDDTISPDGTALAGYVDTNLGAVTTVFGKPLPAGEPNKWYGWEIRFRGPDGRAYTLYDRFGAWRYGTPYGEAVPTFETFLKEKLSVE